MEKKRHSQRAVSSAVTAKMILSHTVSFNNACLFFVRRRMIMTCLTSLIFLHTKAQPEPGFKMIRSAFLVKSPAPAACHAATLVELPRNRLLAAWFAGPYEGHPDVKIYMADCRRKKWSAPYVVADGRVNDTLRYACWNPVLFRAREGRLFLFYKAGPSPREWWGMLKYSDDNGKTWSPAQQLPPGLLGPIKNKPLQLASGTILHPSSTESRTGNRWKIHFEQSDASGTRWEKIDVDNDTFEVIQPALLQHGGGNLQLLSRSRHNVIVQAWSKDGGKTWSSLTRSTIPNPNAGFDAVTLANGTHVLVYNPMQAGREWFHGRNKLVLATSPDGIRWKEQYILEAHEAGEFSYPAIIQSRNGRIHVIYTYDRKNIRHVVLRRMRRFVRT